MKGVSIAGRKRFDLSDFYETPTWATEELLKRERFEGTILEPACGLGAISKVLENDGYTVRSQDIEERGYGTGGVDFLKQGDSAGNIVTNPPFSKALEFVQWSKLVADNKIAMILKLTFLESSKRHAMFTDKDFPLARIYVFCKRVDMYAFGQEQPVNGGTIAYAWFIWDKSHIGYPEIRWIP